MLSQIYSSSYALIIGINDYEHVSPLRDAVSDAIGIAEVLEQIGFPRENISLLTDADATREAIFNNFMRFTQEGCSENDRIIFFFAGHGHTVRSNRGEVGFLIPHDGTLARLASLIRWDELTRNADLICAKHVLFLMDACYGGLAVTRAATPGSLRFLRDMLTRVSRQVLTAGKADEPVADSGGPLPNHSIFTGHLIQALSGAARDNSGNLTANGVISYVYDAVSRDDRSQQTPHYGYLHGDGDMIFEPTDLSNDDPEVGYPQEDRFVTIPLTSAQEVSPLTSIDQLKELLSENRHRIRLFDHMAIETRKALVATAEDYFPVQGNVDKEGFLRRLSRYEEAVKELIPQQMLLGRWSSFEQSEAATLPIRRMTERLGTTAGSTWLIGSRWYPMLLLLTAAGIGAVVGRNYHALLDVLHSSVPAQSTQKPNKFAIAAFDCTNEFYDAFRWIPGREKNHVARSEHILGILQPFADDSLFIGKQYEDIFDQVELLSSLEYGNLAHEEIGGYYWSPIGRFGWRGRYHGNSPLKTMRAEADRLGNAWSPLQAGFFNGSKERFDELATALQGLISNLPWL